MQTPPLIYTLFGHPVSHSLSPIIHSLFAAQFDLNMSYTTQDTLPENFLLSLKQFRAKAGLGANVTLPLKELAFTLCDKTSSAAGRAQAVNTLYWDESGDLWGDNTDGIGFLRDLKNKYPQGIKNKTLLILGAGGAAAGILPPLLDEQPEAIYLVNRTHKRAINLAEKLSSLKLQVLSLNQLNNNTLNLSFDIIINASSASLENKLFPIPFSIIKKKFIYDLVYNLKLPTVFVQWAREQGARQTHDGLGMLIEQAAEAFYLWHQKRPDTQKVYLFFRQNQKGD